MCVSFGYIGHPAISLPDDGAAVAVGEGEGDGWTVTVKVADGAAASAGKSINAIAKIANTKRFKENSL
jgi:hypothetical protein